MLTWITRDFITPPLVRSSMPAEPNPTPVPLLQSPAPQILKCPLPTATINTDSCSPNPSPPLCRSHKLNFQILSCLISLEASNHPIQPGLPLLYAAPFSTLSGIESWTRQSSDLSALRASTRLPASPDKAAESSTCICPKCRSEYSISQIPRSYLCFCGKVENPPHDNPRILTHSCCEICYRPLKNNCGYFCLLLCHPVPSHLARNLSKRHVFVAKRWMLSCSYKLFSCNNVCNKSLDCGIHNCKQICHDGTCLLCNGRGVYKCLCGRKVEERGVL